MKNQMQEAPLEYYVEKFRELDPAECSSRTGVGFNAEKGCFTLTVLGRRLLVFWPEFELSPDAGQVVDCPKILTGFYMRIIALRYLLEGAEAVHSGVFKSYRELPWGEVYDANFQGRCIKRFAFSFGSKPEAFIKAAEKLGGKRLDHGDASFDLPFFQNIVCRLILWCGDDEFPPSSQILFSDNTQFAWGAEDLAGVGDIIIGALKEV